MSNLPHPPYDQIKIEVAQQRPLETVYVPQEQTGLSPRLSTNDFYDIRDFQTMDRAYQARLAGEDKAFAVSADPTVCQARDLTEKLKVSPLGTYEKAQLVNVFVNRTIAFDMDKEKAPLHAVPLDIGSVDLNWHQTPLKTLETRKGQCSDMARLKHYLLQKAGVDPNDMALMAGRSFTEEPTAIDPKDPRKGSKQTWGYHEELRVTANGCDYMLNLSAGDNPPLYNGGIEPVAQHLGGGTTGSYYGNGPFEPIYVYSGTGTAASNYHYYDPNEAWLAAHDPNRAPQPYEGQRHAVQSRYKDSIDVARDQVSVVKPLVKTYIDSQPPVPNYDPTPKDTSNAAQPKPGQERGQAPLLPHPRLGP